MKNSYKRPEIKTIELESLDIIRTSGAEPDEEYQAIGNDTTDKMLWSNNF